MLHCKTSNLKITVIKADVTLTGPSDGNKFTARDQRNSVLVELAASASPKLVICL